MWFCIPSPKQLPNQDTPHRDLASFSAACLKCTAVSWICPLCAMPSALTTISRGDGHSQSNIPSAWTLSHLPHPLISLHSSKCMLGSTGLWPRWPGPTPNVRQSQSSTKEFALTKGVRGRENCSSALAPQNATHLRSSQSPSKPQIWSTDGLHQHLVFSTAEYA